MDDRKYLSIVSHYESCLERHGDTHRGVDWPNEEDADTRYRVMLDVIPPEARGRPVTLLDFGCGASHLNGYIVARGLHGIEYSGLDISEKFVRLSERKFPSNRFYCLDVFEDHAALPSFDYIVLNGVFTERLDLSFDEMFDYFRRLLVRVFEHAGRGIAFNVMTKHVDWERDDLFHLPFDRMAEFVTTELTRNFVFRNDYGLYDYTTYVYR